MNNVIKDVVKGDKFFYLILGALAGFVLAFGITGGHHTTMNRVMGNQEEMAEHMNIQNKNEPESGDLSMNGMTRALENKTGDEFDQVFLTLMIEHHQGAVDMANEVLKSAKHQELKTLAAAIIEAQSKEVADMKAWQQSWGYNVSSETMPMHTMHQ